MTHYLGTRAALKHHPDRVPSDSPERGPRTKKFQQINAAYYSLSDPTRRRDYDASRPFQDSSQAEDPLDADEEIPRTPGGFPWSAFFGSSAKPNAQEQQEQEERYSDTQFSSAFEEMLREEGMAEGQPATPTKKFWSLIGGVSGAAMGFIVANMPGAVAGAVAGNRLGAVRDAKGKSVYEVFKVSL